LRSQALNPLTNPCAGLRIKKGAHNARCMTALL
jgi:hypothetical protein